MATKIRGADDDAAAASMGKAGTTYDRAWQAAERRRHMQPLNGLAAALGSFAVALAAMFSSDVSRAGNGLLGVDHKIDPPQDTGIWSRDHQQALQDLTVLTVVGGALWFGSENAPGAPSGSRSIPVSSAQRPPRS